MGTDCSSKRRRRGLGLAAINGSGWGTVASVLPQLGTEANVIAIAEHRLSASRIAGIAPSLRRAGWALLASPALSRPGGGPSGGVGFLARSFLDVGADGVCSPDVVPGRVYALPARLTPIGQLVLYSVYLSPCMGFRAENADLASALLCHAHDHGLPWLALGDWNAEPSAALQFFTAVS